MPQSLRRPRSLSGEKPLQTSPIEGPTSKNEAILKSKFRASRGAYEILRKCYRFSFIATGCPLRRDLALVTSFLFVHSATLSWALAVISIFLHIFYGNFVDFFQFFYNFFGISYGKKLAKVFPLKYSLKFLEISTSPLCYFFFKFLKIFPIIFFLVCFLKCYWSIAKI